MTPRAAFTHLNPEYVATLSASSPNAGRLVGLMSTTVITVALAEFFDYI